MSLSSLARRRIAHLEPILFHPLADKSGRGRCMVILALNLVVQTLAPLSAEAGTRRAAARCRRAGDDFSRKSVSDDSTFALTSLFQAPRSRPPGARRSRSEPARASPRHLGPLEGLDGRASRYVVPASVTSAVSVCTKNQPIEVHGGLHRVHARQVDKGERSLRSSPLRSRQSA